MCRILYRFLALLARLAVRCGRSKDLEIIVLRHQLGVLHRQNTRPALADEDRALLDAIAAALPRPQRAGWLVTPETLLPVHAPVANAFAERWIGSLRRELLDRTIIWNQRQLEGLVIDYIAHYNNHRPHRSLNQRPPRHTTANNNTTDRSLPFRLARTTRCDGLINEYKHAA